MAKKVENAVEDYLDYSDDNMIPLENKKNIIGLEDSLSDNITEHKEILTVNTGAQLSALSLPEMTNIKVEDEIVSCTLKKEIEGHLDDVVLFEEDTNYVNDIQLMEYIKDEEIEFRETSNGKHIKTEVYDTGASDIKIEDACVNNICIKYENKILYMQCPHCKIYLEQWEYLEYHMSRCRDNNDRQCSLSTSMDQMSASSAQNKQHEPYKRDIESHGLEHYETRTTCNSSIQYEVLKRKLNLKLHLNIDEETKRFKCWKCDYETNNKSNLQKHLGTHEETKRFKCWKCNYATNYKYILKRHVLDHGTIKQFKCSKCDHATNNKRNLQQHFRTHEGTKRFKCAECDYATNRKQLFKSHVLVHEMIKLNEKPVKP